MFVSDRIVFIELHKTGCTHIGKLLAQLIDGRQVGKHNRAPAALIAKEPCFLGSIRDPWEWYVSLWAYGCDHRGELYTHTTKSKGSLKGLGWRSAPLEATRLVARNLVRDPAPWHRCYADVNDPQGFRDWLRRMHDRRHWHDFAEGYGFSPVSRFGGLLTYRYLKLFCAVNGSAGLPPFGSHTDLTDFERAHCYIDHFIRNERLEEDLIAALEGCGEGLSDEQKQKIRAGGRSNTSTRKERASYYYDAETAELVRERDRLIVEKFGYEVPEV